MLLLLQGILSSQLPSNFSGPHQNFYLGLLNERLQQSWLLVVNGRAASVQIMLSLGL